MLRAHPSDSASAPASDHQFSFTLETLAACRTAFAVAGDLKPVDGHPQYAVSSCGRVFSCAACRWRRDEPVRELLQFVCTAGLYRGVHIHTGKKAHTRLVHRLIADAFLSPALPGQTVVRHLDGNPNNNAAGNLARGTQAENMQDCIRHGRTLKGMRNTNAKLSPVVAEVIRKLDTEGFSRRALAAFFGVTPATVDRVCSGESWGET